MAISSWFFVIEGKGKEEIIMFKICTLMNHNLAWNCQIWSVESLSWIDSTIQYPFSYVICAFLRFIVCWSVLDDHVLAGR